MADLATLDILEFIPQRPPIVMVEGIESVTDGTSVTTFLTISEHNIFAENGVLQEPGLIENMAQSAATMEGYWAKQRGEKVRIGFIGAVKGLKINALPVVGSKISTTIEVDSQVMDINIVKGTVYQEDKIIAECTLNIFLQ